MKLSLPKKILSYGNLFAFKPQFNVNKEKGYHSIFSFTLSFLFYIILFLMVIYFSDDWINQTNPQVGYTGKNFNDKINITLDQIIKGIYINKEYKFTEKPEDIFRKTNLTKDNFFTLRIDICVSVNILKYRFEKNLIFDIDSTNKTLQTYYWLKSNDTFLVKELSFVKFVFLKISSGFSESLYSLLIEIPFII